MNHSNISKLLVLCLLPLVLFGCGGGSGGSTFSAATNSPSYEMLDSTAESSSPLGGVAINKTPTKSIVDYSGSMTHNTGAVVLIIDGYEFTDSNGVNSQDRLTSADGGSVNVGQNNDFGEYGYVTSYDANYTFEDQNISSIGFAGIITQNSDVPTSGAAEYNGESAALVVVQDNSFVLNGDSKITANFNQGDQGRVKVELTNLSGSATTESEVSSPIDSIIISDMVITENRFSGGTLVTYNQGAATDITGQNTTSSASGAFYGYDSAISAPDEVAGVALSEGVDGHILGRFIAD